MMHTEDMERDRIYAEEAAVVNAQSLLHSIMEQKGVSRADLARAMDVSRARITQIFSDDCSNFTVRLLARALYALDEELFLGTVRTSKDEAFDEFMQFMADGYGRKQPKWLEEETLVACVMPEMVTANDNIFSGLAEVRGSQDAYEEMAA